MDWYRNKVWSSDIEKEFETRLRRSRGTFHKAQYLKIQGLELLDTLNGNTQTVGINLLLRVIEEYPSEKIEVINSHEALGDFYLRTGQLDKAENHLRIVVRHCVEKTRNSTSGMADIKLADLILQSNQTNKFDESYGYIINFPVKELSFNSQRFYYFEIAALLCDKMGNICEANLYALKALELSKITTPDFPGHKTLGLVKISESQISGLQKIAGI